MFYNYTPSWARISKRLGGPGIDSKKPIPPGWDLIPGLLKMFTVHIRALYCTISCTILLYLELSLQKRERELEEGQVANSGHVGFKSSCGVVRVDILHCQYLFCFLPSFFCLLQILSSFNYIPARTPKNKLVYSKCWTFLLLVCC